MNGEHMRKIASLGGRARLKAYGNPGTPEGRRLGGIRSLQTHQLRDTGFRTLRKVRFPRSSARLAELIGIFMGDGHVHTYQATVCTNAQTDKEHALYIKNLVEDLFHITVSLTDRSDINACTVVISSKEICRFLVTQGLPQGSKIALGLNIPEWILERTQYKRAFLRGLIDTDGCVYEDKHVVKGRLYSSTCIAFTSASPELREFVGSALREEGWNPTFSGRDVRLRRKRDVLAYAKTVGFSNPKHARKIRL